MNQVGTNCDLFMNDCSHCAVFLALFACLCIHILPFIHYFPLIVTQHMTCVQYSAFESVVCVAPFLLSIDSSLGRFLPFMSYVTSVCLLSQYVAVAPDVILYGGRPKQKEYCLCGPSVMLLICNIGDAYYKYAYFMKSHIYYLCLSIVIPSLFLFLCYITNMTLYHI